MNVTFEEARRLLSRFKSLKGRFPFRLGTTSYIYPAELLPNVRLLGDIVDEIQLLLFESAAHSNIPDDAVVRQLRRLSAALGLSYSIHLPLDIFPGQEDESIRRRAVETILRFHEIGIRIGAQRFIFHYATRNPEGNSLNDLQRWRMQLRKSTEELLRSGIEPQNFCVENLAYPFSWVADLVEEYSLACCIDIGHLRVNSFPVKRHLTKYMSNTRVIHLHGLKNGIDHHGLSRKDERAIRQVLRAMEEYSFRESLILEVFQLDHLLESLQTFESVWRKWEKEKLY